MDDMPVPFKFPTECGSLNLEWYIGHAEHSLEVDFDNHTGMWAWWDGKSGEIHEENLDLRQNMEWEKLQKFSTGQRTPTRENNPGTGRERSPRTF